jgi:hypothetical protein
VFSGLYSCGELNTTQLNKDRNVTQRDETKNWVEARQWGQKCISDEQGANAIMRIEKTKALRLNGLRNLTVRSRVHNYILLHPYCSHGARPCQVGLHTLYHCTESAHRVGPIADLRGRFFIGYQLNEATMSGQDGSYYLTLHVDLLGTILDDFIEHAETVTQDMAYLGLLEEEEGQWRKGEDREPPEYAPNSNSVQWDFGPAPHIVSVSVSSTQKSKTSCTWHGFYLRQGIFPYGKPRGGKMDFTLIATHYRRDRLNVAMWESPNIEPILGDYLLAWMKQYWRDDGIDNLMARGVQSPSPPVTPQKAPPPLPKYASSEQWDAWFDWYYHEAWGPIANRVEHWVELSGKRKSTVEKKHADYMTNKRDKVQ